MCNAYVHVYRKLFSLSLGSAVSAGGVEISLDGAAVLQQQAGLERPGRRCRRQHWAKGSMCSNWKQLPVLLGFGSKEGNKQIQVPLFVPKVTYS